MERHSRCSVMGARNVRAGVADVAPGTVINIGGGGSISMRDLVALVERTVGAPVPLEWRPASPGDVMRTGGNVDRAGQLLAWQPEAAIEHGVHAQVEWHSLALPMGSWPT